MSKISVVIPCYNDSKSIVQMHERLTAVFKNDLPQYDYEIIFVDDRSPDDGKTWGEIKRVCESDICCKGARNAANFGWARNCLSSLRIGTGDATFMLMGDLQDPPEYLPEFVKYWESGNKVVVGQHSVSYDSLLLRLARKLYYYIIAKMTGGKQFNKVTGFGLFDRSFIKLLHQIEDIQPVIAGIVSEYAGDVKVITVKQEKSLRGKSNFNFWRKYDFAMMSITATTKSLLRIMTFVGFTISAFSILFAMVSFIMKLLHWHDYPMGMPSLIFGMFFLGGVQLFFLGIVGEYVLSINNRTMKRPLVVFDEKINFDSGEGV
jgi:glycosyltransferase involved in cell wall biosynthesis